MRTGLYAINIRRYFWNEDHESWSLQILLWIPTALYSFSFKARARVGMGEARHLETPIPLPTSPLKGEEKRSEWHDSTNRFTHTKPG